MNLLKRRQQLKSDNQVFRGTLKTRDWKMLRLALSDSCR